MRYSIPPLPPFPPYIHIYDIYITEEISTKCPERLKEFERPLSFHQRKSFGNRIGDRGPGRLDLGLGLGLGEGGGGRKGGKGRMGQGGRVRNPV